MYQKKVRVLNPQLLFETKQMPCLICHKTPSDPDHITTRGAGGGDTENNIWPLCRTHHNERHAIGIARMATKYKKLIDWLHKHKRFDVIELIERKGSMK
jgi:5-methylcytosine-specific restriction endonuclease McrA